MTTIVTVPVGCDAHSVSGMVKDGVVVGLWCEDCHAAYPADGYADVVDQMVAQVQASWPTEMDDPAYAARVAHFESLGMPTTDAQAAVDAELASLGEEPCDCACHLAGGQAADVDGAPCCDCWLGDADVAAMKAACGYDDPDSVTVRLYPEEVAGLRALLRAASQHPVLFDAAMVERIRVALLAAEAAALLAKVAGR